MRQSSVRMLFAVSIFMLTSCGGDGQNAPDLPVERRASQPWVVTFIATQRDGSQTVVEQSSYNGKTVFHVIPEDRVADSGNEHIIYAADGGLICEFGGIVPKVTKGSCDISELIYQKKLFPR